MASGHRLTLFILAGLILGTLLGEGLYRWYAGAVPAMWVTPLSLVGNTIFMGALKMVLLPLIVSSVIVGVCSIGDPRHLGRLGGRALLYYFGTMLIAVLTGLVIVSVLQPGDPQGTGAGLGLAVIESGESSYAQTDSGQRDQIEETGQGGLGRVAQNLLSQLVPANPLGAAANFQLLPVIAFSIFLGLALVTTGERARPLVAVFESLLAASMRLVDWILALAPIGVLALVAWTVARIGLSSLFGPLSWYVLAVLLGLAIHGGLTLPLLLRSFSGASPWRFARDMRPALLTAFGTDSSSATLPVTMECAEAAGASKRSSRFVLPLGATINMDGTALYEAVAVVFLFQAYGISLGPEQLIIVAITATLAAIGAAGIPSAGLVTMVIVVEAVNASLGPSVPALPLAAVGIILGIDRLLDMCRTVVNVWGDAVGARILSRYAPDDPSQDVQ